MVQLTMEVLKKTALKRTKFLELNELQYVDNKGKAKKWISADRPDDTRAVVIAAMVDRNLVIIKEFRVPLNDYIYELPAGLVEKGEDPVDAGKREFLEETGYRITRLLRPISPPVYSSPGMTSESCYMMFAEAEATNQKPMHGDSEDISVMVASRVDIHNLLKSEKNKIGAKAYLVFLQYLYESRGKLWQPQDR